jgi:predicted RNA binding protein YcfA (HicA-like mRNA interferase family)
LTKRDKLRRKIRNNPNNVKFTELKTLLAQFGFNEERSRGSHHYFRHESDGDVETISIPVHGNKVKPGYVKRIMDLIDALMPEDEEEDSDDPTEESDDQ